MIASFPILASIHIGPVQFDEPAWLLVFLVLAALTAWIGRQSLSGLGTRSRRIALGVRLLVLLLIMGAIARPQWRTEAKDVAVTAILDSSRSIPQPRQRAADEYVRQARVAAEDPEARLGVVTVGEMPIPQALPSKLNTTVERLNQGNDLATNLAAGVRLAMAIRPEDAAYRLLLISDGNETSGSLLEAAEAARAARVPIDVLPVRYTAGSEVAMEQLVAPATARAGESVNVRVVLSATKPAQGRLSLLLNDEPVDLDPDSPAMGMVVDLKPGSNVFAVPVTIPRAGPQRFRATFEPLETASVARADTILENNEQLAVTFVSSEGRVLLVGPSTSRDTLAPLIAALEAAKLAVDVITADRLPQSLTDLNAYDGIILADQPSYDFSQQAQEDLRQYVHDTGGGLIMVGGPNSFGAGGWIGSPLEDALPVRLDPPQKRQMPRGALMIISHSVEMPQGVTWGKKTASAAVDALSRLDLVGLVEFQGGTAGVVHPLSEVGDGSAVKRSINNLTFGDMFESQSAFQLCIAALAQAEAGAKHIIFITDGDASPPTNRQIQDMLKEKITVSTVGVFPHNASDLTRLGQVARATRGRHYEVVDQGGLGQIVQIFIKEAQTVKRSLIWEGAPFVPTFVGAGVENMRGLSGIPPLSGYVVTGDREGLAQVTLRGKENDPIAAQWQYGLGRVFTYTSDAAARWNPAWVGWNGFRAFWEQTARWAMRPAGNPNVRVTTERDGDTTRIIVDALDAQGERLNFARFTGRLAGPQGSASDVDLKQVGPGRYEGRVPTKAAGSYVLSLRYASRTGVEGRVVEGAVQAAITKPFADEFRATEDNLPLLQRVASMTGGKILAGDPKADAPWRREGLTFPVSTRSIWPFFALAAIALFLADVAVRRVRIDVGAIRRALFSRSARVRAGEQLGGLRQARERARESMTRAPDARASAAEQRAAAAVKFEASAEQLKRPASIDVAGAAPAQAQTQPAAKKPDKPAPAEPLEGGLSRLKQAKKRAQEDMD